MTSLPELPRIVSSKNEPMSSSEPEPPSIVEPVSATPTSTARRTGAAMMTSSPVPPLSEGPITWMTSLPEPPSAVLAPSLSMSSSWPESP
jgi:hypothetical protein